MTKVERIILYSVLGVVFILGLVFDLTISKALFEPTNGFGRFWEAFAEVPAFSVGCFGLCLIAFHHPKPSVVVHRILFIGGLVLAAGVAVYCGIHNNKYLMRAFMLNYGTGIKILVIVLISLLTFALGFFPARLIKKERSGEAFLLGIFIIALFACSLLLMQALKMIWFRPRFRTLVALQDAGAISSVDAFWLPVWKPQFFTSFKKYEVGGEYGFTQEQIAKAVELLGITKWGKDEFYSFPSGHTMNTLAMISLCYVPRLFEKADGKKNLSLFIRLGVYAFAIMIAFTRILRGAHNLTDVSFGFLLVAIAFDLGSHFFYERFLRERFLPRLAQ